MISIILNQDIDSVKIRMYLQCTYGTTCYTYLIVCIGSLFLNTPLPPFSSNKTIVNDCSQGIRKTDTIIFLSLLDTEIHLILINYEGTCWEGLIKSFQQEIKYHANVMSDYLKAKPIILLRMLTVKDKLKPIKALKNIYIKIHY